MKTTVATMGTLRGTERVMRFVANTVAPDARAVEPDQQHLLEARRPGPALVQPQGHADGEVAGSQARADQEGLVPGDVRQGLDAEQLSRGGGRHPQDRVEGHQDRRSVPT